MGFGRKFALEIPKPPMSALGQKRTSRHVRSMSALPPKADITSVMSPGPALLDRLLQDRFLNLVAVCVLDPRLIADASQVLDQSQCVFRPVRIYLRAAARAFCLNNHTHSSNYPFAIAGRRSHD